MTLKLTTFGPCWRCKRYLPEPGDCPTCHAKNAAFEHTAIHDFAEELLAQLKEEQAHNSKINAETAVGIRFDVFHRDGFRCTYCGKGPGDGVKLHADHVIPKSKGGPDSLDNLVTSCQACNIGKRDKIIQ